MACNALRVDRVVLSDHTLLLGNLTEPARVARRTSHVTRPVSGEKLPNLALNYRAVTLALAEAATGGHSSGPTDFRSK